MSLHTLASVQTRKQLDALIARIEARTAGRACSVRWGNISVSVLDNGAKVLSSITANGRQWSVQVSADIAAELSLPLWKDIGY